MLPKEIDIDDFAKQASPTIVQLARHFGIREAAAVEAYAQMIILSPKEDVLTMQECLDYLKVLTKRKPDSLNEREIRVGTCLGLLRLKPKPHMSSKVGRNDPCPCGSGAKYKRCCLDKD